MVIHPTLPRSKTLQNSVEVGWWPQCTLGGHIHRQSRAGAFGLSRSSWCLCTFPLSLHHVTLALGWCGMSCGLEFGVQNSATGCCLQDNQEGVHTVSIWVSLPPPGYESYVAIRNAPRNELFQQSFAASSFPLANLTAPLRKFPVFERMACSDLHDKADVGRVAQKNPLVTPPE